MIPSGYRLVGGFVQNDGPRVAIYAPGGVQLAKVYDVVAAWVKAGMPDRLRYGPDYLDLAIAIRGKD